MSKLPKRKITVDLGSKPPESARPSVFERLGTKKAASKKTAGGEREHCRQWAAHGVCAYGKGCKFATTHTLVSPSKARAANKEDSSVSRLHSAVVRADEFDTWDQSDLEYADTDVLEKRRQQLQRELDLQFKMDSGKTDRKPKKKPPSSSSSSRSSSSSSASSSTTGGTSSSSSSERDRKKGKKGKLKRNSSSSSDDSPKKKKFGKDSVSRSKSSTSKKTIGKKDDRLIKKHDAVGTKKKVLLKMTLTRKKSLSPGKKASGTPPISKTLAKSYNTKHSKSPARREKNRSVSPTSIKEKEKERQREREREREKDRDRSRKSRSPQRKARSRSPRRSHPRDQRRKESSERSRPISPKKARQDQSTDKHRKTPIRDRDRRDRDVKDKSLDRRKDDKDRHEREKLLARQRERDNRLKDNKREVGKRGGGRGRQEADRGLEKPSKPMERLLPRPEERLAALAAISNRNLEDKSSRNSKDRQELDRGRKQERIDRDRRERSSKRERMSMERDHVEYDRGLDRGYDRGHSIERGYERVGERYEEVPREGDNRSPGYVRERHYDPGYDIPGHPRYSDPERDYGEHMGDHRGVEMGFDERRRREHSWEGSGSLERERVYHHPHKEWEGEEFHQGGEWGRERHWQHRDQQMGEWAEKEAELEPGWHHRGHPPPGPHRPRVHDEGYGRNMRMEHPREQQKRRPGPPRPEVEPATAVKPEPGCVKAEPTEPAADCEDMPIPDDLSEISDDPDDILNRDDMVERGDDTSQVQRPPSEERPIKTERSIKMEPQSDANSNTQETPTMSPPATVKVETQEAAEEDMKELDFEEISDGELEEERTRAGLGDALGVDWASLVAEVRRNKNPGPPSGAQQRWQPAAVLARVGVSVAMAGPELAAEVASESGADADRPLHPVASIQVAIERRKRQRAALFGTGCEVTRALSARRDLALRRHLCNLPPEERSGHGRGATQPHLFHAARTLLMQSG